MEQNTEIIQLDASNIFVKCEWQTFTGTPKARLVYLRLQHLERQKLIKPGMTLCDVSTGSEGAALAQIGGLLGYKVEIWFPDYSGKPFIEYVTRFGGKVRLVSGDRWLLEGSQKARKAGQTKGKFYFNQADAIDDAKKAYGVLGLEFARQLKQQGIRVYALISVIGSGGLLLGTALAMKKVFPNIKVYGIEMDTAPYLHASLHHYTATIGTHHVWGIASEGSTRMKEALLNIVDDVILINEKTMRRATKNIPKRYHISVDYPSAGNIMGAEILSKKNPKDAIATIWTAHGWRTLI